MKRARGLAARSPHAHHQPRHHKSAGTVAAAQQLRRLAPGYAWPLDGGQPRRVDRSNRRQMAALRRVTGGLMARPGSAGDVDATHPGGADVQPRHVSRQTAPGLNKAIQRADGTQCRSPDKEIDRPGPRVGPLQPGCHHTRTRLEVLQHIGNRLRATQHVVREVKQRGIGMPRPAR